MHEKEFQLEWMETNQDTGEWPKLPNECNASVPHDGMPFTVRNYCNWVDLVGVEVLPSSFGYKGAESSALSTSKTKGPKQFVEPSKTFDCKTF